MAFFDDGKGDEGDPHARKGKGAAGALTSDLGPLPVWGWAIVLVGSVYLFRKMSAGKGSSTATGGAAGGLTATAGAYPTSPNVGGVYVLPGGAAAPGSSPIVADPWSPPVGEQLQGSGFWLGPQSNSLIKDAAGSQYSWIPSGHWEDALALNRGGTPLYYQPNPGVFAAFDPNGPSGKALVPGTPIYLKYDGATRTWG